MRGRRLRSDRLYHSAIPVLRAGFQSPERLAPSRREGLAAATRAHGLAQMDWPRGCPRDRPGDWPGDWPMVPLKLCFDAPTI